MLTEKQRADLNAAVLEYLLSSGYKGAAQALKQEAGLSPDSAPSAAATGVGEGQSSNLERKWTAILRLNKRIEELEAQVVELSASAKTAEKKARGGELVAHDFFPRDLSFTLAGHRKQITALASHPLFDVVVSGSEDAAIRLWDTSSGVCERTLTGHTGTVTDLAFEALTGSGLLLASSSNDSSIKLWDFGWAAGGVPALSSSVTATPAASSSGASSDGASSLLTSPLPPPPAFPSASPSVLPGTPASSSSSSSSAASAGTAPTARPATYACIRTLHGHDGPVLGVAFLPRTATLLSCSRDGTLGFWDCESGHCLKKISVAEASGGSSSGGDWLRRIAVNFGGNMAVTCSNEKHLSVWDLSSGGRITRAIHGHDNVVECVALSSPAMDLALRKALRGAARGLALGGVGMMGSPGPGVASSSSSTSSLNNLTPRGPGSQALTTPAKPPASGSASGGGLFFTPPASAGGAAAPATPRADAGTPMAGNVQGTLSIATAVAGLSLSGQQGGAFVVSGSRDKSVRVFETSTGAEIACFGAEEHGGWVRSVAWHPSCVGWVLSACEDRCVRILDVVKKTVVRRLPDAIWDSLLSCAILRPPSVAGPPALIVGGSEATIQVWSCK